MNNDKKGKLYRKIWISASDERKLESAINGNEKEVVFDIMFKIIKNGDYIK